MIINIGFRCRFKKSKFHPMITQVLVEKELGELLKVKVGDEVNIITAAGKRVTLGNVHSEFPSMNYFMNAV